VTEYFDDGKRGQHTARVDPRGQVWVTGPPLSRFDPKTQTFRNYKDAPFAYDIDFDAAGNAWLALYSGGNIGVVDVKTDQLTKFEPPTRNSYPRRLRVDHEGIVWFTQYRAGKIGRFDPKTATFKEIDLPGPANPGPYGIGIDRDNYIWYNADYLDTLGRLDPKTNRIVEYPFPYSENMIKEFVLDAQGRLWWGSTGNDKVGYVYVRK
jgi:virginiamycin B lyase